MKNIKRRVFTINTFKIFFLFCLPIGLLQKKDYLNELIKKIKKNNFKINYNLILRYSAEEKKFINEYNNNNFQSFNEFSGWLVNKIKKDYKNEKIRVYKKIYLSETEIAIMKLSTDS